MGAVRLVLLHKTGSLTASHIYLDTRGASARARAWVRKCTHRRGGPEVLLQTRVEDKGQSLQMQAYGICDSFLQTPPNP